MITLKIEAKDGTLGEEARIFDALANVLDKMKEEGVIKDYSEIQVIINSNGGELHGR
jgi:hypothetical protein